jgi:predicted Zn-dependent peptidase
VWDEPGSSHDAGSRPEPVRTVVDGVPVFSLDVPGPLQAMLTFRVGVVDESLPAHGITHVVEHLAMFPIMQSMDAANHFNARVEPLRTRFMATGTPEQITTFLADVTSNLSHLALDRLENEKKILRTEAANKPWGSLKMAWSFRFGSRALGLADFEELGLRCLTPASVEAWAAMRFSAGNAVLWLSGPVPENLRLNLREGSRQSLPKIHPEQYRTPATYQQGDRWVLLSMLGARSTPLSLGTRIFDARVRDRVRHQLSLSYEVHAAYQRLDRDTAEVTAFADSLTQDSQAAAEALIAVARELATDGPRAEEVASVLAERRRMMALPEVGLGHLEQVAIEELEGLEPMTTEELDAEAEALTPAQVADAFKSAFATSFLAMPNGVSASVPDFTPIPLSTGARIKGIQVRAMPGAGHADVIDYSDEGISLTFPNRTVIGMKWKDVAVAMWWNEGRRTLIGPDGSGINVVPAKWGTVGSLLEAIRERVPPDRWVPMDEPGSVPREQGPICAVCEASPAIEVTFQDPRSFFMIQLKKVHGIVCRDCGIANFREVQKRVLVRGWWSLPGLVATPIALLSNIGVWQKIRKLPVPIRTSGINPLPKGRTVWLYPGMLIPGVVVLLLVWFFWPR